MFSAESVEKPSEIVNSMKTFKVWKTKNQSSRLGIAPGLAFSQPYFHTGILHKHLIPMYPHDIVCYGVGSMHHSRNAQFQFALMLLIREALQVWKNATMNNYVCTVCKETKAISTVCVRMIRFVVKCTCTILSWRKSTENCWIITGWSWFWKMK